MPAPRRTPPRLPQMFETRSQAWREVGLLRQISPRVVKRARLEALVLVPLFVGVVILYGATGQIAKFVSGIGTFFGSIVTNVTTTPSASPSAGPVAGAPTLETPSAAYTNESTVDISGTVPLTVIPR